MLNRTFGSVVQELMHAVSNDVSGLRARSQGRRVGAVCMRPFRYPAIALLASFLFASGSVFAEELTLAQVVRLALSRNERTQIAALSVASAEAGVTKARAAFLPTVTLAGNETLRPYTVEQGGRTTLRSNAAAGSLTVTQPLIAPAAFPLYASAKHTAQAAHFDEIDKRRQLCFDAARAFFAVVAQNRVLTAAQRRLERADANLNDMRARAEAQLVSTNDVTRAQIDRANAGQTVATAQGAQLQARVNLEYIVDSTVEDNLHPLDESLAPANIDIGQLTNQALAQRPDVASNREGVAAAYDFADEPGLRFAPTLNAAGQAKVADQAIAGDRYWDTTLTLNLTWQIYDAGVRGADATSRKAVADSAALQLRALQRHVGADVRSAVAALNAARASLQASLQAVESSKRSADETNVLYKQGLAKAIELVDANLSWFDAEVSLAGVQLAVRQAELDLRAALGLFPINGVK